MDSRNNKKDLYRLFIKRELMALIGPKAINLIVMTILLVITLLTLVFAEGCRGLLNVKMNSPFINSAQVLINPGFDQREVEQVLIELESDTSLVDKFNFIGTSKYSFALFNFYKKENDEFNLFRGRTVSVDDPVDTIIKQRLNHNSEYFIGEKDIGILITPDMLQELGYSSDDNYIAVELFGNDSMYHPIFVPVRGIADVLPNNADFVMTPYFYQLKTAEGVNNPLLSENVSSLDYFIGLEKDIDWDRIDEVIKSLVELIAGIDYVKVFDPLIQREDNPDFETGHNIHIGFNDSPGRNVLNSLHEEISESECLSLIRSERMHYFGRDLFPRPKFIEPHGVSLNFSDIEEISRFNKYISDLNENMRIDMAQVKSKENYRLVVRLTSLLIIILIFFSSFALIHFLSQMVKSHLNKIMSNIGTFQAFGLEDRFLMVLYRITSFAFILACFTIAIVISLILFLVLGETVLDAIVIGDIPEGIKVLLFYNFWSLLVTVLLLSSPWTIISLFLRKFFKNTPGDLIYRRIQ
jgi:hypothetical protein